MKCDYMNENTRILTLKNEVNLLRDKLAEKIVLMDHLQLHICPNLDTDYILKFGSLKYKIETNKIECEKIKMKIGLMEKQLNRKSRLNLFEIDEQVENEFRKQNEYLKELSAKLTVTKNHGLKEELKREDFKKLNHIYKETLLLLHPDLVDNFDYTMENYLLNVIEAYENYDFKTIKSIKVMTINSNLSKSKEKNIKELLDLINLLKIRIKLINKDLIKIKDSYPFNQTDFLNDEEKVNEYKNRLDEEKNNYIEEYNHYENIEDKIINNAYI